MIGVFDSGVGGLAILRGIVDKLPQYDYMYLGDTERVPYGSKSLATLYKYTGEAVGYLFDNGCKLVVIACNSASSKALRKIQREYLPKHYNDKKVLGVLIPACEEAYALTKNNNIGVIATTSSVESGAFEREIKKLIPDAKISQKACPLLVPMIEEGRIHNSAIEQLLREYINPLLKENIDTLILGCTHYSVLENTVKEIVGPKIAVISEPTLVAEKLADYLKRHSEVESSLAKRGARAFFATDITHNFKKLAKNFFGNDIKLQLISLS